MKIERLTPLTIKVNDIHIVIQCTSVQEEIGRVIGIEIVRALKRYERTLKTMGINSWFTDKTIEGVPIITKKEFDKEYYGYPNIPESGTP